MCAETTTPAHPLDDFCRAVAQDLAELAVLHDAEVDASLLRSLKQSGFPALRLKLESRPAQEASALLERALTEIPESPDPQLIDDLAADFAGIYLTYAYRASPNESVWTDEENLERQQSMFEVREYYRRHGLGVENWRIRSDDHLVIQLQFLAHLFGDEDQLEHLATAARFMDEHLLRWVLSFARRVATRCVTPLYAGINLLTAAYCDELRDLLAEILDRPRPTEAEIESRVQADGARSTNIPVSFVPGAGGPSW
jgi:TorA maturation chaperone TorD